MAEVTDRENVLSDYVSTLGEKLRSEIRLKDRRNKWPKTLCHRTFRLMI